MNCKRCGKEIVGEIQRYCNDCKRELRLEETTKSQKNTKKAALAEQIKEKQEKVSKELKQVEQIEKEIIKDEDTKEKKSRIFSFGYVLLVIVMMILVFLVSIMIGFSIGPVLPI